MFWGVIMGAARERTRDWVRRSPTGVGRMTLMLSLGLDFLISSMAA